MNENTWGWRWFLLMLMLFSISMWLWVIHKDFQTLIYMLQHIEVRTVTSG